MRNVWFAFLIVLGAALVTHTSGASTGGSTNTASTVSLPNVNLTVPRTGVYCTVLAQSVRVDSATRRILAGGRFRCDQPGPDSLSMTVALQKRGANGQWAAVAARQFSAAGAVTTRDHTDAERTREVGIGCATGTYRTAVNATSVSLGKQRTYALTTSARTNPCP